MLGGQKLNTTRGLNVVNPSMLYSHGTKSLTSRPFFENCSERRFIDQPCALPHQAQSSLTAARVDRESEAKTILVARVR
jgi:hypothetical protein